MKLTLNLVPSSAFFKNLRTEIGQEQWTILSRSVRNEKKRTCQYCGWKENYNKREFTHLHELWEFDEVNKIQRLVGFECVCPTCHSVHHWGFSEVNGEDMDKLLEHACKINQCTKEDFLLHIEVSFEEWSRRGAIDWKIDFGKWSYLIKGDKNVAARG